MPGVIVVLDPDRVDAVLSDPVARDLERNAIRVMNAATRRCPVRTGRLRASIGYRMAEQDNKPLALVGTEVEYALYVEYGTSRMAARPYLRPALTDAGFSFVSGGPLP